MQVTICDLTGQLSRVRRQDLEHRFAGLGRGLPVIDAIEVDVEAAGDAAAPRRRVKVTLRADHRQVARVIEEAPTLAAAIDRALDDATREGTTLQTTVRHRRPGTLH